MKEQQNRRCHQRYSDKIIRTDEYIGPDHKEYHQHEQGPWLFDEIQYYQPYQCPAQCSHQPFKIALFGEAVYRFQDDDDSQQYPVAMPERQEAGDDISRDGGDADPEGMTKDIRFDAQVIQQ